MEPGKKGNLFVSENPYSPKDPNLMSLYLKKPTCKGKKIGHLLSRNRQISLYFSY